MTPTPEHAAPVPPSLPHDARRDLLRTRPPTCTPAGYPLRALDLFCGAGGATKGLQRAGFHVTGVDIAAQKNYCGDVFVRVDVLRIAPEYLRSFDFIWASPPCQGYSEMRHAPGAKGAPKLIGSVREMLECSGRPWVIENVEAAGWAMRSPVRLCGSMFDLGAQGCRLERHRLFEASFNLAPPACRHDRRPVIGVYGGHARRRAASAGGRGTRDVWEGGHGPAASEALGIDWMTLTELSESIPPAYSEFIARAWLAQRDQKTTSHPGGPLDLSEPMDRNNGIRPYPLPHGRPRRVIPATADG